MPDVKSCWHCGGTRKCKCIICGRDQFNVEHEIVRMPGECVACIGREFLERNAAALEPYDPRDRNLWEIHPAHDGNKGYRVFKPDKGLK